MTDDERMQAYRKWQDALFMLDDDELEIIASVLGDKMLVAGAYNHQYLEELVGDVSYDAYRDFCNDFHIRDNEREVEEVVSSVFYEWWECNKSMYADSDVADGDEDEELFLGENE
jgi:hypothetical protein